ncbi:hypothetical protein ACFLSG_00485 [Candidatus Bipolaricaulota bacterium]
MTTNRKKEAFWTSELPTHRGQWLGQWLPSEEPVEFCPEIFSTKRHTFCTAFSPGGDELFFATADLTQDISHLAWMRMDGSVWTKPQLAPFNSDYNDYDICMSPDGQRVCWRSWRPLPGNTEPEERSALWAADRTTDGWCEAFPIECDGDVLYSGYPGIARSGALYFTGRTSPEEVSVYRAQRSGKQHTKREVVVSGMTTGGDLCVAPDESYLVIACWRLPEINGESDLYISSRTGEGAWTPLRNLGAPVNNELIENCPMVTADGKRFFFFRYDRARKVGRTFWVDASIIDGLRTASEL